MKRYWWSICFAIGCFGCAGCASSVWKSRNAADQGGSALWMVTMAWTERDRAHLGTFVAIAESQETASAQALSDFAKHTPTGRISSMRIDRVPAGVIEQVYLASRAR